MRVLLLTQYFTPEVTAAPVRLHPFAAGLATRGIEVEVICEIPSHPAGVVHQGYGGRPFLRRRLDGFDVTYVWTPATPSKTAAARVGSYAAYAGLGAAVASLRRKPDVVLASSPPLTVGLAGAIAASRHRVPWVFDVRDLWPEIAVALGEVTPGRVLRAAEALERRLYRGAAAVTTPTEPFRAHIAARVEDPEKVSVLANGTTRSWLEAGEAEPARAALGMPPGRFVWTYCGNVGLSQDLETAIEAAAMLGDGFELMIVGDGTSRQRLERHVGERGEGNVSFTGLVSPAEAAMRMRASDAVLVSLAPVAELGKSVPIKLYDAAAIGRPMIVAAPGEPARLATEGGFALVLDPGDPGALADAVRRLRAEPDLAAGLADAGREFAGQHLRERQVDPLAQLLRRIA